MTAQPPPTKVVWITPQADPDARSGGAQRTLRLLEELAKTFDVEVIVVGDPRVDAERLKAVTGVAEAVWFPGPHAVRARFLCLRHGWPLAVARMWNPAVETVVERHQDAVVVAEYPQAALYAPSRPYLLCLQNAEGDRVRRLPAERGPLQRLQRRWERLRLPMWESRAARGTHARVVTVSEADAITLGVPATVVANGTVLRPPRTPAAEGLLLFVGALDYAPNAAGLRWWAESVWPHLPAGSPRLTVVGRGGREALGPLASHESLDVVGEVADVASYYLAAALVLVPLLHGGGTRLKILEALAWSPPVLSTTKGAEGLGLAPSQDLEIADTPADFARMTSQLLSSPARRLALAQAGRLAANPFSWDLIGRTLADLVRRVDAERPSPNVS